MIREFAQKDEIIIDRVVEEVQDDHFLELLNIQTKGKTSMGHHG